jgi:hypothetical protein
MGARVAARSDAGGRDRDPGLFLALAPATRHSSPLGDSSRRGRPGGTIPFSSTSTSLLCQKTTAILRRLDLRGRIAFHDAERDWGRAHDRFPDLRPDCLEEMHVVTARGNVYRGFDAYRALAWVMPAT